MPVPLSEAQLVVLDGAEAVAFAHSQFCNDVRSLEVGAWQWNAWLDPQGRVRTFFALLRVAPERLLAWLPLGNSASMCSALAPYLIRAKLRISAETWVLHSMASGNPADTIGTTQVTAHEAGVLLRQPGPNDRCAWIAPAEAVHFDAAALDQWRLADIEARLPLLASALEREFVPQALDLESLAAIRFDKGCYPGQEVAARLHFRGGNKRQLRRIQLPGAAPAPGTAIIDADGSRVGRILYSAQFSQAKSEALAVIMQPALTGALSNEHGDQITLIGYIPP